MIRFLVGFSIRYRGVVLALAAGVLGFGIYTSTRIRLNVFPEFAPPQVIVQTEAPGLSAEQVELLVTRPVESALNGSVGLDTIRSQSIPGLSVVTAVFQDRADLYKCRQIASERLASVSLPAGARAPVMVPLTTSTNITLSVGLTSDRLSPMDLRAFADWTLRPRLLGVPGVAGVVVFGGEVRQIQVRADPERLAPYGLGIGDVLEAARRSTGVRGAGFVETAAQRVPLRTEGQARTAEELGESVLASGAGKPLRLKDVAEVVEAPAPKVGDAAIGGRPGILLVASSQYGANTMLVTEAVERALKEMQPAFDAGGITVHPRLFRPADLVETALGNLLLSLGIGAAFVTVVLYLFLNHFRAALISFLSIPLSLLAAVIVLDRFGATLNTLALGGFAIAIGVVVDDAIVDVENIWRRLRENRLGPSPRGISDVVMDASLEVRSAVVYATFVVALVFLPVLGMSGVQGRLFAPLAAAFVLAVLASLLLALTVTPALCAMLLAHADVASEPRLVSGLKRIQRAVLSRALARPRTVIAASLTLCAAAAAMAPFLGGSFLPEFQEGYLVVQMTALPGTSLPESMRMGKVVAGELLKHPLVRSVSQQAGRAELSEDTVGTEFSEFVVGLKPLQKEEDAEGIRSEVRRILAGIPGASFAVKSYLAERIEETISGVTSPVVVTLYGDDLDALDSKAGEVRSALASVPGAADAKVESPLGAPEALVELDREALARQGFRPLDVLEAVQAACQGAVVAQVYEGARVSDVSVVLSPQARREPEMLGGLRLRNAAGALVPLGELARIRQGAGRSVILHEGARRRQVVTCAVSGRDVTSFVKEAKAKVAAAVKFSSGVYPVFSGEAEARAQAVREIGIYSVAAGLAVVLLLALVFRHWRNLALVLANMPLAFVGGVAAAYMTAGSLSIGSLVGFVTLFGITTRNSILMISHFEHLVAEEGMAWGVEAALRGAAERLTPVLMTALVTALGLLPLAIGSGKPGHEIEGPMAVVILGGLASSTVLDILVLPVLALRFGRFQKQAGE